MQPLGRACVINQDKALKREQAQAVDGVLRNKQTLATSQLIEYKKKMPLLRLYIFDCNFKNFHLSFVNSIECYF